jgi:20S proteasome subunit alpha 6
LVIGVDEAGPHLYECCPSGNAYEFFAQSIGARSQSAKTYLEKRLAEFVDTSLDELIRHGLIALRDTLQQGTELDNKNCSIAVVGINQSFEIIEGTSLDRYLNILKETS